MYTLDLSIPRVVHQAAVLSAKQAMPLSLQLQNPTGWNHLTSYIKHSTKHIQYFTHSTQNCHNSSTHCTPTSLKSKPLPSQPPIYTVHNTTPTSLHLTLHTKASQCPRRKEGGISHKKTRKTPNPRGRSM